MKNKYKLIAIIISLLIAIIGLALSKFTNNINGDLYFNAGLNFTNIFGINLVFTNTLKKTRYFRFVLLLIPIIIIGAIFKIMHWPGANNLIILGITGIFLLYTIHFIQKPMKKLIDVLKWIWILSMMISMLGLILHFLPRNFKYVPMAIMYVLIIQFGISCIKNKELLEE